MKKSLILSLAIITALAGGKLAHGYSSQAGLLPSASNPEIEYKSVFKSNTAGWQDAVAVGDLLSYTTDLDGYTVTRVGTAPGAMPAVTGGLIACVAAKAIASGSVAAVPCITKGLATVSYNVAATNVPINAGERVCSDASGRAIRCSGVASSSGVISLEDKLTAGSGTLKVMVQTK